MQCSSCTIVISFTGISSRKTSSSMRYCSFTQNIIKVCDFGWSIHSPLMRETRCGTPLYSSPEVVQKQHYDNKVDVWNIGTYANMQEF